MPKPRLATMTHAFTTAFDRPAKRVGLAAAGATLALSAALTGMTGTATASATGSSTAQHDTAQHETAQATRQHAKPLTYGLDISNYQADYDWNASPAQFGIVKATEGTDFRDASFARHWQELAKKGIVRGAYHFGHPGNDPIAEAEHFLSVVNAQPAKAGDILVLDLETDDGRSSAEVNAWAKTWLAHVKAKTKTTPMLYSGWSFADTNGKGLSEYPLWVAHYDKPKGTVTPPADWKTWAIHQYSDSPIDQNVSSLTADQLRRLGRPA